MRHQINADDIRLFFGHLQKPVTYASDGNKTFDVYRPLYGEPRYVVSVNGKPVYDGWALDDAVLAYNEN